MLHITLRQASVHLRLQLLNKSYHIYCACNLYSDEEKRRNIGLFEQIFVSIVNILNPNCLLTLIVCSKQIDAASNTNLQVLDHYIQNLFLTNREMIIRYIEIIRNTISCLQYFKFIRYGNIVFSLLSLHLIMLYCSWEQVI